MTSPIHHHIESLWQFGRDVPGGRGVLHTPLKTPCMGRMIKRPGTCGAYAIRPYPTGRRGRAQKQKRMD